MLGEYLGVLIVVVFATLLAGLMAAVHRRSGPSSPSVKEAHGGAAGVRGRALSDSAKPLQLVAVLSLVGSAAAVFLYPWAATFQELGSPSLIAVSLFAVPILVGFLYQWARRAADGGE